jgi:hypothetical protein
VSTKIDNIFFAVTPKLSCSEAEVHLLCVFEKMEDAVLPGYEVFPGPEVLHRVFLSDPYMKLRNIYDSDSG